MTTATITPVEETAIVECVDGESATSRRYQSRSVGAHIVSLHTTERISWMTPGNARKLAQGLIEAADAAEIYNGLG